MDLQNLAYALTQVAHNFGAVIVSGGATAAYAGLRADAARPRRLAWLVLAGWAVQAVSGAGFGAISYAAYGSFPDLHGIAVAALIVKIGCAAGAFALTALYLRLGAGWSTASCRRAWAVLVALAASALVAAAFLRWFS